MIDKNKKIEVRKVRIPTIKLLGPTCEPTALPAHGYYDLSLIIYKKELCKSAFEEKKKGFSPKIEHGSLQNEKKGVPLIYHNVIAFSLKIFPTLRTKNTKNVENVKSSFQFCVCFQNYFQ